MPWEPALASVLENEGPMEENQVLLVKTKQNQPAPANTPAECKYISKSSQDQQTRSRWAEPSRGSLDVGEMIDGYCFKLLSFRMICFIALW